MDDKETVQCSTKIIAGQKDPKNAQNDPKMRIFKFWKISHFPLLNIKVLIVSLLSVKLEGENLVLEFLLDSST